MRGRPSTIGQSPIAEAFGAEISTPERERSLFFVIGRTGPPDHVVQSVGGVVVTHLQDRRRVLAIAPLAAHAALRRSHELALAGPISIDPERFARFARLAGVDRPAPPAARPTPGAARVEPVTPAQEALP